MTSLDTLNEERFDQAVFADFRYTSRQHRGLATELANCFRKCGADAETIAKYLGVASLDFFKESRSTAYDRRLLPRDPIGLLIRLFVLNVLLDEVEAAKLFDKHLSNFLVDVGVLVRSQKHKVQSVISLFWCDDKLFATDSWSYDAVWQGEPRLPDRVMYLGHDSIGLSRVAPRFQSARTLDLCCGCGVQGIVAADYSAEVIGTDRSARAIRFSKFNAALNAVERIDFVLGDLYAPVSGERFSAILANPPFVPTPPDAAPLLFRDGGPNGEEILKRIMAGAEAHGTDDRVVSVVTDLFNIERFEDKLAVWQGESFATIMLYESEIDRLDYVEGHCSAMEAGKKDAAIVRWLDHLDEVQISTIHFGYLVQVGAPGRLHRHQLGGTVDSRVEAHVRRIVIDKTRKSSNWSEMQPTIAPGLYLIKRYWEENGEDQAEITLESANCFFEKYSLSAPAYLLLDRLLSERPRLGEIVDPDERAILNELMDLNIVTTSPT